MSRIDPVVRPVVCGVAASAVGTLAMDASIYRRFRHGGGTEEFPHWEFSEGLTSWENAPPPARVAKKVLERLLGREVPPRYARFLNNATHWGMGVGAGAVYGLLVGSRQSKLWYGVPFGAAVWAGGYVVLPQLGVYEEVWKYDLETLAKDLGAHLVFGSATAGAFALLSPHDKTTRDKTRKELAWTRRCAPTSSRGSGRSTG